MLLFMVDNINSHILRPECDGIRVKENTDSGVTQILAASSGELG